MMEEMRKLVLKRRQKEQGTTKSGYKRDYKKLGEFDPYVDSEKKVWCLDPEDTVHLVPWSKTSNVNSGILIIAQDWASEEFITNDREKFHYTLGYTPRLRTNKFLEKFLEKYMNIEFDDVYRTDAFVFVKPDGMSTDIPFRDMRLSVRNYTIPLIDIMKPRLIITIGGAAYNAIRMEYGKGYSSIRQSNEAVIIGNSNSHLWCVPHTGGRGVSLTMGESAARWSLIANDYRRLFPTF